MSTHTNDPASLRKLVRTKYDSIAATDESGCGAQAKGCSKDMIGDAYSDVEGHEPAADLKLGCGVPTDHAGLESGQVVVDLGSGAGLDAFITRRLVGAEGHVVGIDFSSEMIRKARRNTEDLGFDNVEFIEGDIEQIPLPDNFADVVLSNCVLNLVPDKTRAFQEIFRILKPGAHFTVSDIVVSGDLSASARASAEAYAGCVAGAMPEVDYLSLIEEVGFIDVQVPIRRPIQVPDAMLKTGELLSITVQANVPS